MATIAHVTVANSKPTGGGAWLYEWPQPYKTGDELSTWYATDGNGVQRKVQVDRLTDEVQWASVVMDLGAQSGFNVDTGGPSFPTQQWSNPTLTGLGLLWTAAHDGNSKHFAAFTDTTTQEILRDGHAHRVVHRYMLSKVSDVGSGNLVLNEGVLAHHVWLTFRGDEPDVVEVEVLVSNSAMQVQSDTSLMSAQGGGAVWSGTGQCNTIGFSDARLVLPAGWAAVCDRADATGLILADSSTIPPVAGAITSNAHCFPRNAGTIRRWAIYRTAGATLQQAQDVLAERGLGRAEFNDQNPDWRSYHTVRAYGPYKSLLPRLDIGYSGGYAAAASQSTSLYTSLNNAVQAGTATYSPPSAPATNSDGEFGAALNFARFGIFQPIGSDDVQEPGGADIGPFCSAIRHVWEKCRFDRLYMGLKVDGAAVFMHERTSGKPLRSSDFSTAYVGQTIFDYRSGVAYSGRQPFTFYTQANGGYRYRTAEQQDFGGFIQRAQSWPPHYRSTNSGEMNRRWWPTAQAGWGTAPRSIWNFVCNYRPFLEQVPVATGAVDGGGNPIYSTPVRAHLESAPGGASTNTGIPLMDPEDSQHCIRMIRFCIPRYWLAGDLVAAHVINAFAEYRAYEWSENGYLFYKFAGDGSHAGDSDANLESISPNNRSLKKRLSDNVATPNRATREAGRGEAWVALHFAAQHATMSVADREAGYASGYGVRKRCEMMFDFIRNCAITLNGLTIRWGPGSITGITSPFNAPGFTGVPIPTTFAVMQCGNELPKLYLAYWALLKQLGEGQVSTASLLPQASIDQAKAQALTAFQFVNTTSINSTPCYVHTPNGVFSPYNWVASWNNTTGQAEPVTTVWRGPNNEQEHWQDVCALVELAYRVNGDAASFVCLNSLAGPTPGGNPGTNAQRFINSNSDYAPGLVALLQSMPGADTAFTPPATDPSVVAMASPNPVVQGQPTTITATVTPGAHPTSTGLRVQAALPAAFGGVTVDLVDIGGNVFTYALATTTFQPTSGSIAVTVFDDESRDGSDTFTLTVTAAPTAPTVVLTVSPFPVIAGHPITLYATVVKGTSPLSTGITVLADLSAIGGIVDQPFLDGGVSPDAVGADLVYTTRVASAVLTGSGRHTIEVHVADAQGRRASGTASVTVQAAPAANTFAVVVAVSPNPAPVGATVLVTGTVTPQTGGGTIACEANLSGVGGTASTPMLDDGVSPDVTASDNVFTTSFVASVSGRVQVTASDAVGHAAGSSVAFTASAVVDPTDPVLVSFTADPNPVSQLDSVSFTVIAINGSAPTSTGVVVRLDLSEFGLTSTEAMDDQGGGLWTLTGVNVPLATLPGDYTITASLIDDQLRTATLSILLHVNAFVPVPTSGVALAVKAQTGARYLVALNASERLTVKDQAGARYEIQNSPDAAASVGGNLPVTQQDGTVLLVPFVIPTVPPPVDPPVIVVPGQLNAGEQRSRGGARREQRSAR